MTKARIWTEQIPVGSKVKVGRIVYEVDRMTKKKAVLKVPAGEQLDTIMAMLGVTSKIAINEELFSIDKVTLGIEIAPTEEDEWIGAPIQSLPRGATQAHMNFDELQT